MKRSDNEILKSVKNGDVIGYDIGNNGYRWPIVANVDAVYGDDTSADDEIWLACAEYDCVYTLDELLDQSIVELIK